MQDPRAARSTATTRRRRLARAAVLLALTIALGACGKRGSPRPPLPRGPHPPSAVTARQIGRRALVGFEVPSPKGSKPSQQPTRADLLRVTYQPGFQPPDDPDAFRRRGDLVGQIVADPLATGSRVFLEDLHLTDLPDGGLGWTLRYAVRLRDRRGRSSPLVVTRDLQLLVAAPAPVNLGAEPTADGVRVGWEAAPGTGPHSYNVYRSRPQEPWPEAPLNQEPLAATEYLDREVTTGERYAYAVRVSLSPDRPFREGESSEPREVLAQDRFAPLAPQGLVAVQEGSAVRLFWNPNAERDLSGYRVERRLDGGAWTTATTVDTPSFLDTDVAIGHRVAYRVVALDRAQPPNMSPSSGEVELSLVAEPVAPGQSER